jgi:hypothetical protein
MLIIGILEHLPKAVQFNSRKFDTFALLCIYRLINEFIFYLNLIHFGIFSLEYGTIPSAHILIHLLEKFNIKSEIPFIF